MTEYVVETVRTVFDDDGGRYRVGPDADGYGGVELRYSEEGKETKAIWMCPAIAKLVAEAMLKAADEVRPT